MPVTFHVTMALRSLTDGRERIDIAGSPATVGAALEALWRMYPGLRDRVATEQGEIREHVNVFVGDENIRFTGGLTTPMPESAEISIFHAVSGG
jgi:molybdopterin converting factor small subunit